MMMRKWMVYPHTVTSLACLVGSVLLGWRPSAVVAEDRRSDPTRLVIMTFNAEFLWDGVPPEEGTGDVVFPWKGKPDKARDHMRDIADILVRANADIVNLVEVENLTALTTFNADFLATRGYHPYLVNGRDTFTGQDVALLTRIDPDSGQITRDDRKGVSGDVEKSVSKNYLARITVGNLPLSFIGLHFLSQPGNRTRVTQRQAQADAVLGMALDEKNAGRMVVVWGDFNDYDGADDARDHISSLPITDVLARIRRMSADDPMDDLVNLAAFVPKARRFTAHWDKDDDGEVDAPGELTSIDHILVSPALASRIEHVEIRQEHDPTRVSDHFPIIAHFRLAPTSPVTPPAAPPQVRIVALVPNPSGDDRQEESVTLRNLGTSPVDLSGWRLKDEVGQTWTLSGTIPAGQTLLIRRAGQAMALNNNGDTIRLLIGNEVVQIVVYGRAGEDEVITPGT